ncbi:MAG: hypothetical protein VCE91_16005 [Nitrospinota bacterium]
MRQKAPVFIIGILIGIIVMQWAMPMARAQSVGTVSATRFVLVDDSGNQTAVLFNDASGHPIFGMGTFDSHAILITTDPNFAGVTVANAIGGGSRSVSLEVGSGALVSVTTDLGGGGVIVGDVNHSILASMSVFAGAGSIGTFDGPLRTSEAPGLTGDLNFDSVVDLRDFFIFSDNFGARASAKPVAKTVGTEFAVSGRRDIAAEYRQELESLR